MNIAFSKHAKERIKDRHLDIETICLVLDDPDLWTSTVNSPLTGENPNFDLEKGLTNLMKWHEDE